jgi:phytoene synthase
MNTQIKKLVKQTGTSLFWGMHILPTKERRAIYTLCAFCQHIDNVVNGDDPLSRKLELIKAWRQEIDNIYDKKVPESNVGRNIYKNCMRFHLPKQNFVSMLDSVVMDLPKPIQAPSEKELQKYCAGTACAPGNMSLRILGCKDEKMVEDLSKSLGTAIQLTTILRDVRDDALSNRLYLPKPCLEHAGIGSTDPMTVLVDKNLAKARAEVAQLAQTEYQQAFDLIKKLDKKIAKHIRSVAYIYKRYFDIMQRRGWEVISPKPKLSCFVKMCLVLKAFSGR